MGSFEAHTRGMGSRLMERSGWASGQGLGKRQQGGPLPLGVEDRGGRHGLGFNPRAEPWAASPGLDGSNPTARSGLAGEVASCEGSELGRVGCDDGIANVGSGKWGVGAGEHASVQLGAELCGQPRISASGEVQVAVLRNRKGDDEVFRRLWRPSVHMHFAGYLPTGSDG